MSFNSAHEGPKHSPGFLLWHVSTSWRGAIEAVLKKMGLTHPQFVVLATTGWLTREGELVTQAAIGKMAGLDPNTNSQVIKGLEQKGLLQRASSRDARAKNVSLTQKGSEILAAALPAVEGADAVFFSALSKKELSATMSIFLKLKKE